jgi:hypothetical protein
MIGYEIFNCGYFFAAHLKTFCQHDKKATKGILSYINKYVFLKYNTLVSVKTRIKKAVFSNRKNRRNVGYHDKISHFTLISNTKNLKTPFFTITGVIKKLP